MHVADFSVGALGASALLGGGMGIATGAALAHKLDGDSGVVGCFFGDGSANEGIFHETLNWAARWKLPVVFICENNQYAVTMRHRDVSAVDLISKRAAAYGIPGVTIDGQNVLETYDVTENAVSRARAGYGPTLIECMTYRYTEHSLRMVLPRSRADSLGKPKTYRSAAEVHEWSLRDPILILAPGRSTIEILDEPTCEAIDEEERQGQPPPGIGQRLRTGHWKKKSGTTRGRSRSLPGTASIWIRHRSTRRKNEPGDVP